ncbi:MAG TPA: hypothetical protein VMV83_18030 [Rectinemataceae bacterium]|nr:hypothetical protein [Rectinemataceae bacterium]
MEERTVDLFERWRSANSHFRKKLVFHVGYDAGLFSEINNMALALVYCMNHKIQFLLYSADANFGKGQGWTDIFQPFCTEVHQSIHHRFNKRWLSEREILSLKSKLKYRAIKILLGIDYFTHDLWYQIRSQSNEADYNFPELGLRGDLRSVAGAFAMMVFHFNPEVEERIRAHKNELKLPRGYIGIHIRSGDKIREHALLDLSSYMDVAATISAERTCFVLTDDYGTVGELGKRYAEWTVATLCQPEEHGYDHLVFSQLSMHEKFEATLRLLASIRILSEAMVFIGTFSTNPGMFLGMIMEKERCRAVDYDSWRVW